MLNRASETIEKLTTAVERVHQEIAHMPLDVIESIVPNLPITKKVGEVQAKIIGGTYDVIRGLNKAVAGIVGNAGGAKPGPDAPGKTASA